MVRNPKVQLGVVVRYVKNGKPVEKLIMFCECAETSGEAICKAVINNLNEIGLNVLDCWAKCYGGNGNTARHQRGCAVRSLEHAPKAPYFHCVSHDLNLVLCKGSSSLPIKCMLETLKK